MLVVRYFVVVLPFQLTQLITFKHLAITYVAASRKRQVHFIFSWSFC